MADERVAVITGAARGIGLACARRFHADGLKVVIADVDEDAGREAADELGADDGRALFVRCDTAQRLDVHNLIAETLSAFHHLDVLVANAAITAPGDVLDLDDADFDRVLNTNVRGVFLAGQAAARQMKAQIEEAQDRRADALRRYAIINMSSINAEVALPTQLAYVTSKGAVNALTRAMALALAPFGVRVNAIGPGSVMTDLLKAVSQDPAMQKMLLSRTPVGRFADPDEVAGVAAFLASADASYVTGECVYVDGGRLALNLVVDGDKS